MADDRMTNGNTRTDTGWPLTLVELDDSLIQIDPGRLVNLADLPWESVRRSYRWVKKTFVTSERSNVPSLHVDTTQTRIRELLGSRHFEPNWEFSTYYAGEGLNLRRVQYTDHDRIRWWQVHVRGFQEGDRLELDPHWEPEPTQHPNVHLEGDHIKPERGIECLKQILDEEDVDYEYLDPDDSENGDNHTDPNIE